MDHMQAGIRTAWAGKERRTSYWRLVIKPEISSRTESVFPRFDARVEQIRVNGQDRNNYILEKLGFPIRLVHIFILKF